jgi:type IV secretory pathway TrbD component
MSEQPIYRPVHKALHRPLTVCGVDRRLFFLSLLMGGATFNLFYSFWSGVLVFVGLYGFALWATNPNNSGACCCPDGGSPRGVGNRTWSDSASDASALHNDGRPA